jgi:hypothetical protein
MEQDRAVFQWRRLRRLLGGFMQQQLLKRLYSLDYLGRGYFALQKPRKYRGTLNLNIFLLRLKFQLNTCESFSFLLQRHGFVVRDRIGASPSPGAATIPVSSHEAVAASGGSDTDIET